jgi:hypothetical protein
MRRMLLVLLSCLPAALSGCALAGQKSEVTRRYAAHTFESGDSTRVNLTVFAISVPERDATFLAVNDLAPAAQAELVKAMDDHANPQALVQALALPITGSSATPTFRDLTRMSRRLVFSLENRSRNPADRISKARISIRPGEGTRLLGWDRIANVYDTIDLGTLNLTRERKVGGEVGLVLPVLSATPSFNASSTATLEEAVTLRQRRTSLTGALQPREAVLLQEGGVGIDLTGNVTADIDFAVPAGGDTTVFLPNLPIKDGMPRCEVSPTFERQTLRFPSQADSVRIDVTVEYTVRDVRTGHETVTESDDVVVFVEGMRELQGVPITTAEALRFSIFALRLGNDYVTIRGGSEASRLVTDQPLHFASFADATEMLRWIRRCPDWSTTSGRLHVGGRELTLADHPLLSVWRVPINHGPLSVTR